MDIKKLIMLFLLIPTLTCAADVTLDWDAVTGADGYRIEMSLDMGATWQTPVLAPTKPFLYKNVPEDKLVLFRISAFNAVAEAINKYAGCWYDHRQKLLHPTGVSIK